MILCTVRKKQITEKSLQYIFVNEKLSDGMKSYQQNRGYRYVMEGIKIASRL